MILKALTLENFKGIHEPVRIEFAPLTLLFGSVRLGLAPKSILFDRAAFSRGTSQARPRRASAALLARNTLGTGQSFSFRLQ